MSESKAFPAILFCILVPMCQAFWGDNVTPSLRVNYLSQNSDQVQSFLGNQTHKDHFKLLQTDGVSLLIGARNVVYNLSLADLTENEPQRISWPSKDRERELCLIKGKSEDECQNFIRVLAQIDEENLLVCGTNSFSPKCRKYAKSNNNNNNFTLDDGDQDKFLVESEFAGRGYCPHDPLHNSTAIFTGGQLYAGTVSDFSGSDALIYRDHLRTQQYDLKHLNAPDFVSSAEDEDYVYFFFREAAVEYINCGKAVYSRVARVCKNDRGGPHKFAKSWTTFLKARLNCSVPGDMPFYFDEIQGTSQMVRKGEDRVFYATFTTPDNAIAGSAVCAFRLSDIKKAFDQGHFKGQQEADYNWLPVRDSNVPQPRPGKCVEDSKKDLTETGLNFIKRHSLMDEAVQSITQEPLFVKTSLHERLTVIAVDEGVKTPGDVNADEYDVLYVGTTKGKVLKVISARSAITKASKAVVAEEIQVFPYHVSVTNLQVVNHEKLIVVSDHEVKALPLNRCSALQLQTCTSCVALKDPHCAWNVAKAKCVDKTRFKLADESELLQDIWNGKHAACHNRELFTTTTAPPTVQSMNRNVDVITHPEEIDIYVEIDNGIEQMPHVEASKDDVIYTSTTLTTASLLTAIFALLVGFVSGFLTSRKCSKDNYRTCGHHYLEQQRNLNKHTDGSTAALRHNESGYTTGPCNNLTSVDHSKNNLLVNLPNKTEVEKNNLNSTTATTVGAGPTTTTTATTVIHNGTLPKNGTLCKKVYL